MKTLFFAKSIGKVCKKRGQVDVQGFGEALGISGEALGVSWGSGSDSREVQRAQLGPKLTP